MSLAADAGLDPKQLIYFNFKTNHYPHVNWYLHNYVGCTRISSDKSNFGFSGKDEASPWSTRAGIIYLPLEMDDDVVVGEKNCQDLLFSAHIHADSIAEEYIADVLGIVGDLDLLTTAGKIASGVLSVVDSVWLISGVLGVRTDGVPGSEYAWKFGGFLASKGVPFMNSGGHYSTHETKLRVNLDVLDPRQSWDRRPVSLSLGLNSFAVKVIRGLDAPISDGYRPFPDGIPTLNRDLTIGLKLTTNGPWGLATSVPGTEPRLIPLGRLTESAGWQMIQNALNRWKQLKP